MKRFALACSLLLSVHSWAQDAGADPGVDGGVREHDWAVLPVLAGSNDIGFEFGVFGAVTKLAPANVRIPYEWSLSGAVALSVNEKPGGGVEFPVHDDWVSFDWRSLDRHWRVNADLAFWQGANAGYYGLGNASSPDGNPSATSLRKTQYRRSELVASTSFAYQPTSVWRVRVGLLGRRMAPLAYASSTLRIDLEDPNTATLLLGAQTNWGVIASVGLEVDTRDNEIAPSRGVLVTAALRGGPGLSTENLSFGGFTAHARGYVTLWPKRLVLAGRLLVDTVFGRPPLSELGRAGGDSIWILGGSDGARGVPEGRYQGRIKALADLELRAHLVRVELFDQHFALGLTAFTNAGRAWADWVPRPDLDGTGLGLHVAVGGGVRLLIGDTIMLRLDFAWAPPPVSTEGEPFGFYIDIGHAF